MSIARELQILQSDNAKIVELLHKNKVLKLYESSKLKAIEEINELNQLLVQETDVIEGYIPVKKFTSDPEHILKLKAEGVWPTDSRIITSRFGPRGGRMHKGIDVAGSMGKSNIYAWNDGRVISVGEQKGYGRIVQVYHGKGVSSFYAHLHEGSTIVSVGQNVTKKQILAKLGNTGVGTGPHLHFEIRINDIQVDPLVNGYVDPQKKQ